jgi:hypothetical protein
MLHRNSSHENYAKKTTTLSLMPDWLTPIIWALLEKPPVKQLLKSSLTFFGSRSFIYVFARTFHWFLAWTRSIQPKPPHPISLTPILILSSHLLLGPPSGLIPYVFPPQSSVCISLHPTRATCPTHLILLDLFIVITFREGYKLRSSSFFPSYHFIPLRSKYSPQHPVHPWCN